VSGLTRRRLLATTGLVAATVPLGVLASRPATAGADPYQEAFAEAVAADRNIRRFTEPGREIWYRPGQLLVAPADLARVQSRLRQWDYPTSVGERFAGVARLLFGADVAVPSIVSRLRDPQSWDGSRPPSVQPHHVVVGHGNIMGNPTSAPAAANPLPSPDPAHGDDGKGVLVGVCDTGIWKEAGSYHPKWLGGAYTPTTTDEDPLYAYDDVLALEGGHGTFVAGVLRQSAPGVAFDPQPALTPSGIGDEQMLTNAMAVVGQKSHLINLSLGCTTQDDVPSMPIANALAALPGGVVVVASAGNAASSRPQWPAAFPSVVAVAATTFDGKLTHPTPYSNYGNWVDACAEGGWVSTYVKGQLLLGSVPPVWFDGYASWAGTSFAAPFVTGRIARLMTDRGITAADAVAELLTGPSGPPGYGVLVN